MIDRVANSRAAPVSEDTKSEIQVLDQLSFDRRLSAAEVARVWTFVKSKVVHERFEAYRILEAYCQPKDVGLLIGLANDEHNWLPRSALYAALLATEAPRAITFLEKKFENEKSPNAKYVLGIFMRDVGNQKVLEWCATNSSRQARWIFARLEAEWMLGKISQQDYQQSLKRMLKNRMNWRFIERYLEGANLLLPSREESNPIG